MKANDFDNIICPVADVLGVINDKWTGLILRDLFRGKSKYSELSQSSNITHATLSDRLKYLENKGLIIKQAYSSNRYEYHLTEQGKELAWVILAMAKVGTQWNLSGWQEVPLRFVNKETGNEVELVLVDSQTKEPLGLEKVGIVEKG